MSIQDLGAIGEFISSLVIVATLVVLIYEVRGARLAAMQANAQERQRKRDDLYRSLAESPDLIRIWSTADQHLGLTPGELAVEYGLPVDEFRRLVWHFSRLFGQWRDAFAADISGREREAVDNSIQSTFSGPAFAKWYDSMASYPYQNRTGEWREFFEHVEKLRKNP